MSDFWVIIAKEQSVWNSDPDELTLLKLAPPSDTYLPKMKKEINVTNWKTLNLAFSIKKITFAILGCPSEKQEKASRQNFHIVKRDWRSPGK